jgi:hypothetical protein
VTVFVLLPPLLEKITALLKLPTVPGLKLTATVPVWPGARFNEPPLWIVNGGDAAALPVSGSPPEFAT